MKPAEIESWSFGRAEAAALVGMSPVQVGNYLKRYDLFPDRPRGKGRHASFQLRDLMKLAAVRNLIEIGLSPEEAAIALKPSPGPYIELLQDGFGPNGRKPFREYPGTLFFTRASDGQWVELDTPYSAICIEIRAWPIFDELWPRVRAQILKEGRAGPQPYPGSVDDGIAAFEQRIAEIRAERWGDRRVSP